jgi:DNA polymerase-3 subunit beta
MPGIIIPKKTVGELVKLLEEYTGEVAISLSQNKITFTLEDIVVSSKLIDGKFPDYDRVIPKNNDKTLEISRDQLARAIDLVISISNDKTRAVRLNIEPKKVVVNASSEINGNAKGAEEVAANFDSQDTISIGFNSRYVLDSLAAIDGDTVKMQLSNNLGAVAAQDSKENNCLYILMPMQV